MNGDGGLDLTESSCLSHRCHTTVKRCHWGNTARIPLDFDGSEPLGANVADGLRRSYASILCRGEVDWCVSDTRDIDDVRNRGGVPVLKLLPSDTGCCPASRSLSCRCGLKRCYTWKKNRREVLRADQWLCPTLTALKEGGSDCPAKKKQCV